MKKYPIFVGGKFVETSHIIEVANPYDGKAFATTFLGGEQELEAAIQAAQNAKRVMAEMPSYKRSEALAYVAAELIKNRESLAETLSCEAAKPFIYALAEIDRAASTFYVAAEEAKRIPREYLAMDWTASAAGKEGFVKYFPVGIVAGIAPFNFPMNLACHKIAPALAAGCQIILKPATRTPLSTLRLAEIIDQTDLPKGCLSVIPMDRATGNILVTDERFALLTFTGSPDVGWKMKTDAGKKKVVLELGGNAGVIVTPSADFEMAVKKCVIGAFAYQGQVCIHTQRIYVHDSIVEKFLNEFVSNAKALKHGHPTDPETKITSMIDEENAIRVESWIQEAVAQGATLLCGGKRNGTFVEPSVLTNVKHKMKVSECEIFGPVVVIEKYTDFKNAVEQVNNSRFGLQTGVFTNDAREIDYAFQHLEVGGVMINETSLFRTDHMPYGGVKDSGLGREGVRYAILDMMEPKLLVRNVC
ncbi:MAG: aldehyde dehydrogenase family protein [Bacteroidota bacterium]